MKERLTEREQTMDNADTVNRGSLYVSLNA